MTCVMISLSEDKNKNKRKTDRFSVAPMVDYTDRHARFLFRLMSQKACLYTEMITTNAILHSQRNLLFHPDDSYKVVLQLGGADPQDLSSCAKLGEKEGYSAINLNCGCPSPRVAHASFGVQLMESPKRLVDCVRALQDAVSLEVSVKHRLGIDYTYHYSSFRDFIGQISLSGVRTFIIHARNAVLERPVLPKWNLCIPTLRYDFVYQIKRDFPDLNIIINGHLSSLEDCQKQFSFVDGVMLGRAVLRHPWMLHGVDSLCDENSLCNESLGRKEHRFQVISRFIEYAYDQEKKFGIAPHRFMKYAINIMNGTKEARLWRQTVSGLKDRSDFRKIEAFLDQAAYGYSVNQCSFVINPML